jgi:membrane protease YdiL (CAAX protease family)
VSEFDAHSPEPETIGSEPPPVVEDRRNPTGWVLLGLLFFFLIVNSLMGSLQTKPGAKPQAKKAVTDSPMETVLAMEVSLQRLVERTPNSDAKSIEEGRDRAREMLREPISSVVSKSETDPEAARLYAAMRTERGDPVPPESLAPLQKSKDARDNALARIYGAKTLSRAEAEQLGKALPDEPFVYRLAKVHALEKSGDREVRKREFTGNLAVGLGAGFFIGITIFLGSIVAWSSFLSARRQGKLETAGLPVGQISLADADRLAMRAWQIFATSLVASYGASYLVPRPGSSIVSGLIILASLPLWAQVPVFGKKISLSGVGLSLRNFGRDAMWGVGAFFVEVPISLMLILIGTTVFRFLPAPSHPAIEQLQNTKSLMSALPIILFGSITAPIWEEFVFRGLIFQGLARVLGRVLTAALINGLLFAMLHPQGIAAWLALGGLGAIGCGLTYVRRSLVPSIVMHMLNNTMVFVLLLITMAKP